MAFWARVHAGVKTAQLRGSLKELLYVNSDGNTAEDRPKRGYVKLVYCTDEGEQIAFSRHIQPSSASDPDATYQSVYRINDRQVGCSTGESHHAVCNV